MVLSRASASRAVGAPRRAGAAVHAARTALAALALLLPCSAGAIAPPGPELLPVLGARCDSAKLVRVVTHRSTRLVRRLRLEADAVVVLGAGRVALIEVGTPPEKLPTRIAWSDVESVSVGRSRTGQGLLAGALIGAALGGAIVGMSGTDLAERGDNAVLAFSVLVGLGCAGIGTLLGAGNPEWTLVYP